MAKKFLAHISEDGLREQLLKDHLIGTGKLAEIFAEPFKCGELGRQIGNAHDIGKFSQSFQRRFNGGPIVDHSTAGAIEISRAGNKIANWLSAYCVAGHHSGLPDGGSVADGAGMPTLRGRLQKQVDDYSDFTNEVSIDLLPDIPLKPLGKGGFTLAFLTRMLFSCLVDADFLDTEKFMTNERTIRPQGDTMEVLNKKLNLYVERWMENNNRNTINGRRTEILRECMKKGKNSPGCFTLTVPTGGGKTISSLAFALRHAAEHGMNRIIYVIPFNSIIEQNAEVFRNILGKENVLEVHSNVGFEDSKYYEEQKLAAENFDLPVVVTTNVQFFESFYSNKTSKCRKLHNIANSIIIFDEAQMLPSGYLLPCLQAISELIINYNCTAVLCTATQPALKPYFAKEISSDIREICNNVEDNFRFFKRNLIKKEGEISEEYLVAELRSSEQVLCILNSKKSVQKIFDVLKEMEGIFHLSTYMYPEHRKRTLKKIRERLETNRPCRVISTSLIEAGVDLDFPVVWREIAGVDSVIQAAGRCNREGKHDVKKCSTHVFSFSRQLSKRIPYSIQHPISVSEEIIQYFDDITGTDAVYEYFRILYNDSGEGLDKKNIVDRFEKEWKTKNFPFETVAREFHIIDEETKSVLIPKEAKAKEIAEEIKRGKITRNIMRQAGLYSVNLYNDEFDRLLQAGQLEVINDDFAILTPSGEYSMVKGLETGVTGRGHFF